jgi:hypothetical protein
MGMAHLLVEWGIFKKVKIGFLPVGHTHDDVDQMFSCFSTPLKRAEIFELRDIENVCKGNYEPTPQFFHLDHMASWATHFAKLLPKQISGITKPRCFVIFRDTKGVVRHKYRSQLQTSKKDANSADCWMPVNGSGYRMFEKGFPDPFTVVRVPTKAADLGALKETLRKTEDYMSVPQQKWWLDVIARFAEEDTQACEECTRLRELMKENSVVKKDLGEARTVKGRLYKAAYKLMYKHLGDEENRSLHQPFYGNDDEPLQRVVLASEEEIDFGSPIGKLLQVRTSYQWVNGAWSESMMERVVLTVDERLLVEKLDAEKEEGVPNHVVSNVRKEKDRDAARQKENPDYKFETGDWCVLRQDLAEEPFFVGRITGMDMDENDICSKLYVQECGAEESRQVEKKKCLPSSTYRLRWQKEVGEAEVELEGKKCVRKVKMDQYTSGNKAGEAGYKRVVSEFQPECVVEWGKREKMLTKNCCLLAAVLKSISANPRVNWKLPDASSSSSSSSAAASSSDLEFID